MFSSNDLMRACCRLDHKKIVGQSVDIWIKNSNKKKHNASTLLLLKEFVNLL